jgi:hypothetical protein
MNSPLTIVSGYWKVTGKYATTKFENWLNNTLTINCPYVFFGNEESINIVKSIRKDLPTHYVNMEITEFYSYCFKDTVKPMPPHVPSTEVNLIWNEKINLVEKAKELDPFGSDFFMWVDAGIYQYRERKPDLTKPYPNEKKLKLLPTNKFIFSTSDFGNFEEFKVHDNNYYHYISAGCFIMHKSIVNSFAELYRKYMRKYLSQYNWINTEQKILTHIYTEHRDLFYCLSYGYGTVVTVME